MSKTILFTHPAYVHDITCDDSGIINDVEVGVDIDGRYFTLRRSVSDFDCEIIPEKRIMCEGIIEEEVNEGIVENERKYLRFRNIIPIKFNKSELRLLKKIVSSFKAI